MENYKKMYENALNKAKEIYNRKDASESGKSILESMFPELNAPKSLIGFLINFNNGEYTKPNENEIDSWICWIEKHNNKYVQSTQETANDSKNKKIAKIIKDVICTNEGKALAEKHGVTLNDLADWVEGKIAKKPVLSNDDDWMLTVCCNAIDEYKQPIDKARAKQWLKFLILENFA